MSDSLGWSEEELSQLIDDVMHRSMIDPEFRQLALASPGSAAARLSDRPLPATFQPRFVETSVANPVYILPEPMSADGLLSDLELEAVAGGSCFITNCMITNCMITNCMITNCQNTIL